MGSHDLISSPCHPEELERRRICGCFCLGPWHERGTHAIPEGWQEKQPRISPLRRAQSWDSRSHHCNRENPSAPPPSHLSRACTTPHPPISVIPLEIYFFPSLPIHFRKSLSSTQGQKKLVQRGLHRFHGHRLCFSPAGCQPMANGRSLGKTAKVGS